MVVGSVAWLCQNANPTPVRLQEARHVRTRRSWQLVTPTFAGMPLRSAGFPAGALFRLSKPPRLNLNISLEDQAEITASSDHPFVIVRLRDDQTRFRDSKDRSLLTAQRVLDMVSANAVDNLEIWDVRGAEHHMVWWSSKQNGSVLRWTSVENIPEDVFEQLAKHFSELTMNLQLPPNVRIAEPPAWPPWHPSFRYYRLAQVADDRVEAFRNIFLALESLLDHVLPAANSGSGETDWICRALDEALVGVDLGKRFVDPAHGGSPRNYIVAVFYRFHRGSLFHSKLSYGADKLRIPHMEREASVEKLEQALGDLKHLYLTLARVHLGLDYRGGFVMAPGGFDLMMSTLTGKTTLHLTDDPTSGIDRVDEIELNPRGHWMMEMRTRNAARLERRMTRYFLGVADGAQVPPEIGIRGVAAAVGDAPVMWSDTEGILRPQGFDRIEVLLGMTALNQGVTRTAFRT